MLEQKINPDTPDGIANNLVLLNVDHLDFNNSLKKGEIIADQSVVDDIKDFFELAFRLKFPIEKVILPIEYNFDDEKMMADNNSSGFNYRKIAGSKQLSAHALGKAIDINTRLNPYIRYADEEVITQPTNAVWDISIPGTLYKDHELVKFMKSNGWNWGGDWTQESGRVDYQHFEKV